MGLFSLTDLLGIGLERLEMSVLVFDKLGEGLRMSPRMAPRFVQKESSLLPYIWCFLCITLLTFPDEETLLKL